ncbi:MAG: hypothetical protein M1829_005364 [Trizodia sp. TS-e1964]|nr:MAG: hypothetical protein M1829_005364 [Trizodia sp. TS-e1964]
MAPVETTEDYCAILDVPQTASTDDIKRSYHRPEAILAFQTLVSAYQILNNTEKRIAYNRIWPQIKVRHCEEEARKAEELRMKAMERVGRLRALDRAQLNLEKATKAAEKASNNKKKAEEVLKKAMREF